MAGRDCGCNGTPPPADYAAPPMAYVIEGADDGAVYNSLVEASRAAAPGERIVPVETPAAV